MTIEKLYEWAKEKGVEKYPIELQYSCEDDYYAFEKSMDNTFIVIDKDKLTLICDDEL